MNQTTLLRRGPSPPLPIFMVICLIASLAVGAGCASKQKKSDREADEVAESRDRQQDRADGPEQPSEEQLADSPCGNPDWARLPPQHREDGDLSSEQTPATSDPDNPADDSDSKPDEDDE